MPRRRIHTLPPVGDPRRAIFLSTPSKLGERLARQAIREAARGLFSRERETVMKEAEKRILIEATNAVTDRITTDFTPSEKKEMDALIWKEFQKILPDLQSLKKKYNLDTVVQNIWNVGSAIANSNKDGSKMATLEGASSHTVGQIEKIEKAFKKVLPIAGHSLAVQHLLKAMGINAPLDQVFRYVKESGLDPLNVPHGAFHQSSKFVERRIIEDIREKRIERLAERAHSNVELNRIRLNLSRFSMPKGERRQIFHESREQMKNRSTGISDWALVRGFKKARLEMRQTLEKIGMNPDSVFNSIGIDKENENGIHRLKILTTALRSAPPTHIGAKTMVERVIQRYEKKPATASPGLSNTQYNRLIAQAINPRKQVERIRRAVARAEEEKKIEPIKQPPKEKLPTTAGGYLALFSRSTRVTDEMAVGLAKFLQSVPLKTTPQADVDHLVEHAILTEIATRFQKSGRVTETGLRALAIPQTLHTHFGRALANLIRKGYLEYESHASRSDFIAITDAGAKKNTWKI